MKHILSRVWHITWIVIAVMLVVMAVMVTLARGLTPLLNDHRVDFEKWASALLHQQVQIGRVQAWWDGLEPDLKLTNVAVLSHDKKEILLHINTLQINLNVFKSLLHRTLSPSKIDVEGVHIVVRQQPGMKFSIQDALYQQASQKKPVGTIQYKDALDWLFIQPSLYLQQVQVDFHNEHGALIPFNLANMHLQNNGKFHALSGFIHWRKDVQSHCQFGLLLKGNLDDAKNFKGSLYLDLKNIQLNRWISKIHLQGYQIKQGAYSGKVWLNWAHQSIQSVQSLYHVINLHVSKDKIQQPLFVHQVSGNLLWERQSSGWRFISQFNRLHMDRWQTIPGFQGLSGVFELQPDQGRLNINSTDLTLDFGKLFPSVLKFDQVKGFINWYQRFDQSWIVKMHHVSILNKDIALQGDGALLIPQDGSQPILSTSAGFDLNNTSQINQYFPIGIFKKNLSEWLNHAFVGGKGATGTVLIRGPIHEFPFDEGVGTFIIDSMVHDASFHFAPNWPTVHHLNAELIFKNRSMYCHATSGDVSGNQLKDAVATIPVMGKTGVPEKLNIKATVVGDTSNVLTYVHNSPLEDSIGEDLRPIKMTGATQVGLNLNIPLNNPDDTTVKGKIDLHNNILTVPHWNIKAYQLNGSINFTNHRFWSDGINAQLFNEPVVFKIQTKQGAKQNPYTQISLDSHLSLSTLEQYLNWPKYSFAKGDANYHAVIDLKTAKGDHSQNNLSISSDLKGISIDLPDPIGKQASETVPFTFQIMLGADKPPKAQFDLGKKLSGALIYRLEKNQPILESLNLRFGSDLAEFQTQPGLYIDGFMPTFDWSVWQTYFNRLQQNILKEPKQHIEQSFMKFLRKINIKIWNLTISDYKFINAQLNIVPKNNIWNIGINSLNIDGQITLPKDYQHEGIRGEFKKLYLPSMEKKLEKQKVINPATVPPLTISIDDLKYGKAHYQGVELETYPRGSSLQVKRLELNSSLLSGIMEGSWRVVNGTSYISNLSGVVRSNNIDQLMKSWGIHSSVVGTTGQAQFKLSWPGPIYSPKMKIMSGSINVKLGKGWIMDVGQGTSAKLDFGRLLTLLNINRLLFMNFSDLTGKGYGFDTLTGDLTLKSGEVSTRNLLFDGSIAKILAVGQVHLVRKSLNLNLAITPYLTSSLPAVATIAGGPIVGAATWVANKVFSTAVEKFTTYHYRVTGSWEKPVIKELK